jgi:putative transcriptional regulator
LSAAQEEYAYLSVPPYEELRSCVGLVLAGMAARAKIGVGGLEEAVELLEGFHSKEVPTRFRFTLRDEGIVAEVEERPPSSEIGEPRWRTVVELVS